jgi:hypothetical protein
MPEPPRRARFQIHLSTAIVMMFVAGGLIHLNIKGKRGEFMLFHGQWNCYATSTHVYGWPFTTHNTTQENMDSGWNVLLTPGPWLFLCLDVLTVMIVLYTTWFLCESLIRGPAARKED